VSDLAPRLANDAIGKRLQARSLSATQEANLIYLLKHYYNNGTKQIEIHSGEPSEEQNYASQFERIFKESGWKVSTRMNGVGSSHGSGLSLGVMDGQIDRDTKDVKAAFSRMGLDVPVVDVQNHEYIDDNQSSHAFLLVLPAVH
jgi:hypothetical protein